MRKIFIGLIMLPIMLQAQTLEECQRAAENNYPLIHIQKEPIFRYWKPEASRFHACENGSLLILAPWSPETIGDVNGIPKETDYSIFHNLNKIAEEICTFNGTAVVKRE